MKGSTSEAFPPDAYDYRSASGARASASRSQRASQVQPTERPNELSLPRHTDGARLRTDHVVDDDGPLERRQSQAVMDAVAADKPAWRFGFNSLARFFKTAFAPFGVSFYNQVATPDSMLRALVAMPNAR